MAHLGQERRPTGDYFTNRHDEMSQGDIYIDAPIWRPPFDSLDPWDVSAGAVMVLTPSCLIDKQPADEKQLLVAPVTPLESIEWHPADRSILTKDDCLHMYMYLPAHDDQPERVVEFLRAQPIRADLLGRCERICQLTPLANRA